MQHDTKGPDHDASTPTSRARRANRTTGKRDRTHWLYILVIIGVVAGIVVGLLAPDTAKSLGVLGELCSSS